MYTDLEEYLDTFATPEMGTLILNASRLLEAQGIEDHLFPIQNELARADNETGDLVTDGILPILISYYQRTLRQFGITVDPEAQLLILYSTLEGLGRLENWEDKTTLNILTASDEGYEAALADVLEELTCVDAADFMQAFTEVSPDLITRMNTLTVEEEYNPNPSDLEVAAAQVRLRNLFTNSTMNDLIFMRVLDSGLRLGLPFTMMIAPYLDALSHVPAEKLGQELVAFAYASSLSNDEIPEALAKVRSAFTLSVNDAMVVERNIKQLL